MHLPYAYTSQIWPPIFTALVLIALAFYSWQHRSVPGTLPFAFALLLATLWMAGISLEFAAVDASAKIFWAKFQAAWMLPIATGVICFLLEYAWPGHWLTRRNLVLLSIPCLLALGLILTDDFHHLVWQGFELDGEVIPLNGPGNWIILAYAYALGVLNLVVLAWLFIRSPLHPDPILFAARQMGVPPETCLMIGDTTVDMRAGKAAGAKTVGVLCGFGQEAELHHAGADLILATTSLITSALSL